MWELIEQYLGCAIWQGQDGTGRKIYGVTFRHEGMAVEPSGSTHCYGLTTARIQARWLVRKCAERAREALA